MNAWNKFCLFAPTLECDSYNFLLLGPATRPNQRQKWNASIIYILDLFFPLSLSLSYLSLYLFFFFTLAMTEVSGRFLLDVKPTRTELIHSIIDSATHWPVTWTLQSWRIVPCIPISKGHAHLWPTGHRRNDHNRSPRGLWTSVFRPTCPHIWCCRFHHESV